MSIKKISEFVGASSPQNSDKLLIERNGSGKSITVENLLSDLNNKTRINYLRPDLETTIRSGVTCTANGDGTYTLNGTATNDCVFVLGTYTLPNGTYKLIGNPSSSISTYYIDCRRDDDSQVIGDGTGNIFSTAGQSGKNSRIVVYPGAVCNNLIIKPMITDDLSATYDDFVSYNDSLITGSSQYFFGGIDTNNTIFYTSYLSSDSKYTATEDCYVMGRCYPGQSNINLKFEILIDNISTYMINASTINNSILAIPPIPLRRGQTINFASTGQEYTYIVFGVKR